MVLTTATLLSLLLLALQASAVSVARLGTRAGSTAPAVQLDDGTFIGTTSPSGTTNEFLGIPFAQPPCVSRRGAASNSACS
jgi:hypothetical protein